MCIRYPKHICCFEIIHFMTFITHLNAIFTKQQSNESLMKIRGRECRNHSLHLGKKWLYGFTKEIFEMNFGCIVTSSKC